MEEKGGRGKKKIKSLEDLYGLDSYGKAVLGLTSPRTLLPTCVRRNTQSGLTLQVKYQPMIYAYQSGSGERK